MNIFLDLFKEDIESDGVIISIDIGTTTAKVGLIRADNLGTIIILNKEYPKNNHYRTAVPSIRFAG